MEKPWNKFCSGEDIARFLLNHVAFFLNNAMLEKQCINM